jgi:hypothetical protein
MSANDKQVDGTHYQSTFQHWDFVVAILRGRYLEGCITKYVTRYKKKNGLADVQKALHYTEKLIELYRNNVVFPLFSGIRYDDQCREFVRANISDTGNLCGNEYRAWQVIVLATHWSNEEQLQSMRSYLATIIETLEAAKYEASKKATVEALANQPVEVISRLVLSTKTTQRVGEVEHIEENNFFDYDGPMSRGTASNEQLRREFREALARNDTSYASKLLDLMSRESIDITGRVGSRRIALANRFTLDQMEAEPEMMTYLHKAVKDTYCETADLFDASNGGAGTPSSGYTNQG